MRTFSAITKNQMLVAVDLVQSSGSCQTGRLVIHDTNKKAPDRALLFSTPQVAEKIARLIVEDWGD